MDFTFAPDRNRGVVEDLVAYKSKSPPSKNCNPDKAKGINFRFPAHITKKLGWVRGDRVIAGFSKGDKAIVFERVGLTDPKPAYRISFTESKSKRTKNSTAHFRIGCNEEAFKAILEGHDRRVFSFFEIDGNKSVFVAD